MKKIITKKEQQILLDWIFFNENKFLPNVMGPQRKFLKLDDLDETQKPQLIWEIKNRILLKEKIFLWEQDPFFGDMVTFNSEGGFIHKHMDPSKPNKNHIRFNLFLSKPIRGGDPIYNDKLLSFEERSYIRYCVNKNYHESLPVIGNKPRICISYGVLIDEGLSPIG